MIVRTYNTHTDYRPPREPTLEPYEMVRKTWENQVSVRLSSRVPVEPPDATGTTNTPLRWTPETLSFNYDLIPPNLSYSHGKRNCGARTFDHRLGWDTFEIQQLSVHICRFNWPRSNHQPIC